MYVPRHACHGVGRCAVEWIWKIFGVFLEVERSGVVITQTLVVSRTHSAVLEYEVGMSLNFITRAKRICVKVKEPSKPKASVHIAAGRRRLQRPETSKRRRHEAVMRTVSLSAPSPDSRVIRRPEEPMVPAPPHRIPGNCPKWKVAKDRMVDQLIPSLQSIVPRQEASFFSPPQTTKLLLPPRDPVVSRFYTPKLRRRSRREPREFTDCFITESASAGVMDLSVNVGSGLWV